MPDVFPAATEEAIDYAIDAGVLVVFAALLAMNCFGWSELSVP